MSQRLPNLDPVNFLLTDVAQHIQLSATDYGLAQERYRAISEYLCADESPVAKYKPIIYPQGSFRIQSTISSSDAEDRFDIDLMLELNIDPKLSPDRVIGMVANALDRGAGSRYHKKVEARRRCVTVQYDRMHLDVTPAVLVDPSQPRTCQIFDTHPNRPDHVLANPEGFSLWFDEQILPQQLLLERAAEARKAAKPVPDQAPLAEKPLRLLALQLLKRWRDRRADVHKQQKVPSVLLAKLIAMAKLPTEQDLVSVLDGSTLFLRKYMQNQLHETNPRCALDILTDRWPGAGGAGKLPACQLQFLDDLELLLRKLAFLREEQDLSTVKQALGEMFGERTSSSAFARLSEAMGAASPKGQLGVTKGTGAVLMNATGSAAAQPVQKHSFFGSDGD